MSKSRRVDASKIVNEHEIPAGDLVAWSSRCWDWEGDFRAVKKPFASCARDYYWLIEPATPVLH